MKKPIIILLLCILFGCKQRHQQLNATVIDMVTMIPVPEHYRDIGADSIQLLVDDSGKITANFCYWNNLRYKKDTVYTSDTAYRLYGIKIRATPECWITSKTGMLTLTDGHFTAINNGYTQLDSITINGYQIKIKKVQ